MTSGGRKPKLPPEVKKSEIIFARVTPDQYRAYRTMGDRQWLRGLLATEITLHRCDCGAYHGNLPCFVKEKK